MTRYNTLDVKLSNSQHNKLTSGIKNGTQGALKHSLNVSGDSNDLKEFPNGLLLTNIEVSSLRKAFANNYSASIKL